MKVEKIETRLIDVRILTTETTETFFNITGSLTKTSVFFVVEFQIRRSFTPWLYYPEDKCVDCVLDKRRDDVLSILMTIFKTCLGVTLLGAVLGFAQEEGFDPLGEQAESLLPKMVRIQVEYVETMTELLAEPRKAANDTPLRAKLQELVKEGKAKIIETQMVTARSGQRASTESVHEFIFPIEYDSPEITVHVPENDKPQPPTPAAGPPTPVAWETRNLGSTLEIEPNIGADNKVIDLRLHPTLLYHTGDKVWHEETKEKDTYRIQMPDFYKISFDTAVILITGQPFLMAAVSPKDEKGVADFTKKVLIFVRADVLTVGR